MERLEWRCGTEQAPLPISIGGEPISCFGGDNEAVIEGVAGHQVFGHLQGEDSDGAIADEGVARAGDSEDGGEMAGGRVEDGFGKEDGACSLRAGFDDLVI